MCGGILLNFSLEPSIQENRRIRQTMGNGLYAHDEKYANIENYHDCEIGVSFKTRRPKDESRDSVASSRKTEYLVLVPSCV